MQNSESGIVDLGFVTARVPRGAHICQIYSDREERDNALLRFVARGLLAKEATACFSDNIGEAALRSWLQQAGLSLDEELSTGRFVKSGAESVYFQDNRFDPDRMLGLLVQFHQDSVTEQRAGARIIGEMSPAIGRIDGGSRLFEYEGRVNQVLRERPVTAVCQYDARSFDGATIMDVLAVHPMMFVHGSVIQNPFYVPAEELTRT